MGADTPANPDTAVDSNSAVNTGTKPKRVITTYLRDLVLEVGMRSQQTILDAQLKAGFPLIYCDREGNMLQKNPDGTIEIVKRKEDVR
jgi:hypothetical protein